MFTARTLSTDLIWLSIGLSFNLRALSHYLLVTANAQPLSTKPEIAQFIVYFNTAFGQSAL